MARATKNTTNPDCFWIEVFYIEQFIADPITDY